MSVPRSRGGVIAAVMAVTMLGVALTGCGGDDADAPPLPVTDQIAEAVESLEEQYGVAVEYFEISANLDSVGLVVAESSGDDTVAVAWTYASDQLAGPETLGVADGVTFSAPMIDFDSDSIFDTLNDDLDYPVISDFAIVGSDAGVVYDATVLSDEGGVLQVQLASNGAVLAVVAIS